MKKLTSTILLITFFLSSILSLFAQDNNDKRIVIDKQELLKMEHETTSEGKPENRPQLPSPVITFTFNKKDGIYKTGEEAIFTIDIKNPDKSPYDGECQFQLTDENSKPIKEGILKLSEGKSEYRATSLLPGFIRLYITAVYQGRKTSNYATVGFDPGEITASQTLPEDFMSFWTKQKAGLDAIPLD